MNPIPGQDAIWLAECIHCDDCELFVSRGGFRIGGIEHCYACGREKETKGIKQSDIDRMIISTWCHWRKYPIIPYNWHQLPEEEKWIILKGG